MTNPDPTTNAPAGNAADNPAGEPAGAPPNTAPDAPADGAQDDLGALRAEIERLRRENAASRVNAKATAAAEAKQQFAQEIGKILGLVHDETPVDAGKLAEQLTAAQQASRQSALELAVYKAAGAAGANPVALVDSRTFLASVADTDPADTSAIAQAITQAVTQNPALAAAAPPASGMRPNPSQGRSATPPAPIADQAQAALSAGNTREAIRLKARLALSDNP